MPNEDCDFGARGSRTMPFHPMILRTEKQSLNVRMVLLVESGGTVGEGVKDKIAFI